jgi:hypothetical protein
LEYIKDRIRAVAAIDLVGEWVVAKVISGPFGVLLGKGNVTVEERLMALFFSSPRLTCAIRPEPTADLVAHSYGVPQGHACEGIRDASGR